MLTLFGIFLIAFAEFLFDYKAYSGATNWYIFYFSVVYLGDMLITIDLLFRENSKSMRTASIMFSIFFLSLIINEVRFINVPFETYINSVNSNKIRLIGYGLLVIVLIFISLKAWEKRLSKK